MFLECNPCRLPIGPTCRVCILQWAGNTPPASSGSQHTGSKLGQLLGTGVQQAPEARGKVRELANLGRRLHLLPGVGGGGGGVQQAVNAIKRDSSLLQHVHKVSQPRQVNWSLIMVTRIPKFNGRLSRRYVRLILNAEWCKAQANEHTALTFVWFHSGSCLPVTTGSMPPCLFSTAKE